MTPDAADAAAAAAADDVDVDVDVDDTPRRPTFKHFPVNQPRIVRAFAASSTSREASAAARPSSLGAPKRGGALAFSLSDLELAVDIEPSPKIDDQQLHTAYW